MANYGIHYMGSKDKIIHKIAAIFPSAENFYDLFGGGFSVSHFMLLHHAKRFNRFVYNEIKSDVVQLVRDAIDGKYNYTTFKPKWVSREEFSSKKDSCAYTRLLWSFGNNQKNYLFGREIEGFKKSLHQAVVFNEFDAFAFDALGIQAFPETLSIRSRRLFARTAVLKRTGELQQLERLQQLELSSDSYDAVKILPNSVVYCDPPYKGTAGYLSQFDHENFWAWVVKQEVPVFVSEYQAPKGIPLIMAIHKKTTLSAKGSTVAAAEKVFGNLAAQECVRNLLKK